MGFLSGTRILTRGSFSEKSFELIPLSLRLIDGGREAKAVFLFSGVERSSIVIFISYSLIVFV